MGSEHDKLFSKPCEFIAGVDKLDRMIPESLPEVAFAGRSNVGKSSLINTVTGRKALARTSNTPGRTQQLNFFLIAEEFHLVDLPGYGYAKVSKTMIRDWTKLLKTYLKGRVTLRLCLLLIDSRHGIKESDSEIMKMLDEAAVPYRVIFTKVDKMKASERQKMIEQVEMSLKKHPAAFPNVLLTSSETKEGVDELRDLLIATVRG